LTSLEKLDGPVLGFRCSGFDNFRVKIEAKKNMRKFEVQACLRHGKGEKEYQRVNA
jgi:hypothetical protein